MDPLSIAASIASLVCGVATTALGCKKLINSYHGAPQVLLSVQTETRTIQTSLSYVQMIITRDADKLEPLLSANGLLADSFDVSVAGCSVVFTSVSRELADLPLPAGIEKMSWMARAGIVWQEQTMKTLLEQMRSLSINLQSLLQILQMESSSRVEELLRQQISALQPVRANIESAASARLDPTSGISRKNSVRNSIVASTLGSQDFSFDEILVNSSVYRKTYNLWRRRTNVMDMPILPASPAGSTHSRTEQGPGHVVTSSNQSEWLIDLTEKQDTVTELPHRARIHDDLQQLVDDPSFVNTGSSTIVIHELDAGAPNDARLEQRLANNFELRHRNSDDNSLVQEESDFLPAIEWESTSKSSRSHSLARTMSSETLTSATLGQQREKIQQTLVPVNPEQVRPDRNSSSQILPYKPFKDWWTRRLDFGRYELSPSSSRKHVWDDCHLSWEFSCSSRYSQVGAYFQEEKVKWLAEPVQGLPWHIVNIAAVSLEPGIQSRYNVGQIRSWLSHTVLSKSCHSNVEINVRHMKSTHLLGRPRRRSFEDAIQDNVDLVIIIPEPKEMGSIGIDHSATFSRERQFAKLFKHYYDLPVIAATPSSHSRQAFEGLPGMPTSAIDATVEWSLTGILESPELCLTAAAFAIAASCARAYSRVGYRRQPLPIRFMKPLRIHELDAQFPEAEKVPESQSRRWKWRCSDMYCEEELHETPKDSDATLSQGSMKRDSAENEQKRQLGDSEEDTTHESATSSSPTVLPLSEQEYAQELRRQREVIYLHYGLESRPAAELSANREVRDYR